MRSHISSIAIASAVLASAGCTPNERPPLAGEEHPLEEPAIAAERTEPPATQPAQADAEPVRLWVGLSCTQPETTNSVFAFSLDGAPLQTLESPCIPAEGETPSGGQFSVMVPPGEHVLRIDDQTHDVGAHEALFITAETWVRVNHRVMGEAGHMTSIQASFDRDPSDLGDAPPAGQVP